VQTEWQTVLDFWFGSTKEGGADSRWFGKELAFDRQVRDLFHGAHEAVTAGERESWLQQPRSALAYVLVCDQLSRNIYRDSGRAFASDARALAAARIMVGRRWDEQLCLIERAFAYMPYEHAENLQCQHVSVELFRALPDFEQTRGFYPYAERHFDVIARFGRFPQRNRLLGRASTVEEVAFLKQPGSRF
jgi:uncharacterized protein (DUF924 family)